MSEQNAIELCKRAKEALSTDLEGAIALAYQAIDNISDENRTTVLPELYYVLAVAYHRIGKNTISIEYFTKRLDFAQEVGNDNLLAGTHNNLGTVLSSLSEYATAMEHFYKALTIYETMGAQQQVAVTKTNLGVAYKNHNRLDDALNMLNQSLDYALSSSNIKLAINNYLNIGNIMNIKKQYADAAKLFEKAKSFAVETQDKYLEAEALNNIGVNLEEMGLLEEALSVFEECTMLSQKHGFVKYTLRGKVNIGNVYFYMGQPDVAFNKLNEALAMALEINDNESVRSIYSYLSEVCEKQEKYADALVYYKKYIEIKDEVLNLRNLKQLGELQLKYDLEKQTKEAEINRLKHVELKQAFENLQIEKNRSERLLLNILPEEVAEELKNNGRAEAKLFTDVTVLFTDFKNFTQMAEFLTPQELVSELHECFKGFDEIIAKYPIEKIKTVGDAYLAVSGLPTSNVSHAEDIVNAALEIRNFMEHRKSSKTGRLFDIRIGINSGHVVAGIVGVTKFAYDIWGDTVNTAARMEQSGEVEKVNISEATYQLVKDKFTCTYRGEIEAKNKGKMKMYFAERVA